ncbi:unnamed protein product, partial [Prorocentrum cordatum]
PEPSGRGVAALPRGRARQGPRLGALVRRNEPFVLRGHLGRESLEAWSPEAVRRLAGDVELEVRSAGFAAAAGGASIFHDPADLRGGGADSGRHRVNVTVSGLFQNLSRLAAVSKEMVDGASADACGAGSAELPGGTALYGAQIDVDDRRIPQLAQIVPPLDAELAAALGPASPTAASTVYIGAARPRSKLHYDSRENLLCLVHGGHKEVLLVDPLVAAAVLYVNQTEHGNASPVSLFELRERGGEPPQEFPLARYAVPSAVTVRAGDCLYIPIYWFHEVLGSAEVTISLNWWRQPDPGKKDILGRLLCGSRHKRAAMTC